MRVKVLVYQCTSSLFSTRKPESLGLNADNLTLFYLSSIHSVILYGGPAWHSILGKPCNDTPERIQRRATPLFQL